MATVALSGIITPTNVVTATSTTTLTNKTLTAPTIASANLTTALTLTGAAGNSGQVLTSGGSGAAPTWTTASGGASAATPTALGTVYGTLSSTGAALTGIGYEALNSNTGTENTAIGYRASKNNTSGGTNVSVGAYASLTNSTGVANTALGYQAAYYNTASYNTATGCFALNSNTSGANNTANGYQSLYNNITASNSTAIGYQAGTAATGAGNQFFGYLSGSAVTSGSKNTILGSYTGNQDGLDIRTATNYAVISDGDGNRLISTANTLTLALDSAVPKSGTGITFLASQNACADANTLDDYEEGTWTPVDQSGASLTFTSVTGNYTKIGNQVTCWARLTYPTTSSSLGAQLGGIPFQVAAVGSASGGGMLAYSTTAALTTMRPANSSQTIYPQNNTGGLPLNSALSGGTFIFAVVYFID